MSNTYTDSTERAKNQAPTAPDTAIDAHGNRVDIDKDAKKSDSLVGSVVEAAKSAGQRVKEAFSGPSETVPAAAPTDSNKGINEGFRDTSQSAKESGRDTKEKMFDTVDDTKAKGRDLRTSAKESLGMDKTGDRARDFVANTQDRMGTANVKAKDKLQSAGERVENLGYDARDRVQNANDSSATSGSTFQNVKEKVQDVVETGSEKIKQAFSRTPENTQTGTYPAAGSSDLAGKFHTEDAKSKMATAGAKAADQTEDLAGAAKDTLHDKADRVQNWAAEKKHKANADANLHEKNKQDIRNAAYNPSVDPQI